MKPKIFRRNKWANKEKLAKREAERNPIRRLQLDIPRVDHINININVTKSGVYKDLPSQVQAEIDFDKEFDQDYNITKVIVVKLKHGRHKGAEVVKIVKNNPPGVRYNIWAQK